MYISIDHGNSAVKIPGRRPFTSGINQSETKPSMGGDILFYNGIYNTISDTRIPFTKDKTTDSRFYVLTLFAVAYELEVAKRFGLNEVVDVQLLIGLPPDHIGLHSKRYETFFAPNTIENFTFKDKPYRIKISKAFTYPQAFAAVMPIYSSISSQNKVVVVDFGAFTLDHIMVKKGVFIEEYSGTLEYGVIHFFNDIIQRINSEFDLLLYESDITEIIKNDSTEYGIKIRNVVMKAAKQFINDLFNQLRERSIDLRTGQTVFVGGGSLLFRKIIEASEKVNQAYFVENIAANAEGYRICHQIYLQSSGSNV